MESCPVRTNCLESDPGDGHRERIQNPGEQHAAMQVLNGGLPDHSVMIAGGELLQVRPTFASSGSGSTISRTDQPAVVVPPAREHSRPTGRTDRCAYRGRRVVLTVKIQYGEGKSQIVSILPVAARISILPAAARISPAEDLGRQAQCRQYCPRRREFTLAEAPRLLSIQVGDKACTTPKYCLCKLIDSAH